jgi:stage III sporulation protein AE
MKRDKLFRLSLAILFLWTSFALAAPAAMAASSTALPGSSLWEPYLQQSRIDLEKAASSPWETLKSFLPQSFGALVRQTASRYTSVLLFLTLTAVLGLLAGECTDGALLDLVAAGGCGVLLWGSLLEEAQKLCEQVESWRSFLLGFLPVYAGVLTMGGEGAAGSAASGALLTALCFLAQLAAAFVQPLLHCYLMLSMACCVSSEPALGVFCKGVGSALRQALGWAGKIPMHC